MRAGSATPRRCSSSTAARAQSVSCCTYVSLGSSSPSVCPAGGGGVCGVGQGGSLSLPEQLRIAAQRGTAQHGQAPQAARQRAHDNRLAASPRAPAPPRGLTRHDGEAGAVQHRVPARQEQQRAGGADSRELRGRRAAGVGRWAGRAWVLPLVCGVRGAGWGQGGSKHRGSSAPATRPPGRPPGRPPCAATCAAAPPPPCSCTRCGGWVGSGVGGGVCGCAAQAALTRAMAAGRGRTARHRSCSRPAQQTWRAATRALTAGRRRVAWAAGRRAPRHSLGAGRGQCSERRCPASRALQAVLVASQLCHAANKSSAQPAAQPASQAAGAPARAPGGR